MFETTNQIWIWTNRCKTNELRWKKHNYMKHKRDTQEFQILLGQHNLPNRPNKTFWKQITIDNAVQALAMEASWNHHLANLISPAKLECLLEQPVRWAGSPGSLGIESTLDRYFNLNLLPGMGILNQHQQTHWMWQLVGCVQKRTIGMPQFIVFLIFLIGNMMNQGWPYLIPWQSPNQKRGLGWG